MAILTVGSNQQFLTLSSAIASSQNGDTIYMQHGTYTNDFSIINTNINIVGVGGMVQLVATASPPNGKAILTTNSDVTIDHIEFSGAVVPDANGAGIRYQNGHLTITNSYFRDNQMGLLAAGVTTGSVTIDHSEFGHNIVADGSALGHNLYIGGPLGNFKVTNSYFHDAVEGHELKSRALNSDIENNRIFDNNSTASYSIDLPNGGNAIVKNNIIQQSPNSENSIIIAYSAETQSPWSGSQLQVSGNTIINQMSGAGIGVRNFSNSVTASITGNHIFGLTPARVAVGPNTQSGNDTLASQPALDTSHPWEASPWDNLVSGGAGADNLAGTQGQDLFVGGAGNDTFNVHKGGGSEAIADFAAGAGPGDVAHLDGFGFSNFAGVQAAMSQSGDNAILNLGNGETLTFLHALKSAFAADDFTLTGTASTPIETAGATTLATAANHFSLLANSTGTGPTLKIGNVDVTAGQYGAWAPIGAEKVASGYEVAWKNGNADQYIIWNTDNNGNWTSQSNVVPGSDPTLQSSETLFQQDLNGDGHIGLGSGTPIETAGATTLATAANHFSLLANSTGTGPTLKIGNVDVTAGQYGAWAPIGAEKVASGYEVAWKNGNADQYIIWNTDNNGNWTSQSNVVPGSDPTLQSSETLFQQDLNGDGHIGLGSGTPIETAGATTLATAANHFSLLANSTGTGPTLKIGNVDVTAGQYGAWAPIGAEKVASGYEVAWKNGNADQYIIWNTDNNGNWTSQSNVVPGSDPTLQSSETLFQQDLNGDGHIGLGSGTPATITADRVASGLSGALDVTASRDDFGRLFIVQQSGQISVLNLTSGQVTPFLNVAVDSSGERGLLGLTFDPEYATNGFFYIYRTVPGSPAHNEIERYHVSANPNVADPSSATPILNLGNLSGATNHNGGWIDFGSDGYLYAATGENANPANAQDINNLLGKIIRIDVHNDAFPSDPAKNYAIPSDNMFAATAGADEIFALGLRNPFRNSFDRATGDLYIADVGQNTWEEIDIGRGGANYGWPLYEGPSGSGTVAAGTLTAPIHSYNHSVGNAIIGGYVYRGQSDALQGDLFFADLNGKIFTLHFNGTGWAATERTQQIHTNTGAINTPTSFGEDAHGNLYITDIDGDVFRLTPVVGSFVQSDTSEGIKADTVFAGLDADVFVYSQTGDSTIKTMGQDHLMDFNGNESDRIDLSSIDANTKIADALLAIELEGLTIPADPTHDAMYAIASHIGADIW